MARRRGPGLTREAVIEAGLRVVEEQGPDRLGTTAVAAALGIRAPSVYHHFAGNDALRLAVAVAGWERLLRAVPTAGDAASIRTLAHAYRGFALANPGLYRLMTDVRFEPTDPALLAVWAQAAAALSGLGIPDAEALHALRGLRAALHGFVDLELAGQMRLGVPAEESLDWWVELVLRGLGARREDGTVERTPG